MWTQTILSPIKNYYMFPRVVDLGNTALLIYFKRIRPFITAFIISGSCDDRLHRAHIIVAGGRQASGVLAADHIHLIQQMQGKPAI